MKVKSRSRLIDPKKKLKGKGGTHEHYRRSLNDFDDVILKHILSFLPTKDAVRTSVLSKKWEFMWTSLPSLDFREGISKAREDFMNFVDRVLLLNDAPRLQKFSLSCFWDHNVSRIKTWISYAVRRNTKKFEFTIYDQKFVDDPPVFPHCLFNCEAMEILKIAPCDVIGVQLPSQICLPRLQILTLVGVTFGDYNLTNLLFSSPSLEKLVIDCCAFKGVYELIISAPKLKSLIINERRDYFADKLDEMCLNSVTISSPTLETFSYGGGFIKHHRFSHPSSIFEATLWLNRKFPDQEMTNFQVDHFIEVLRSLRSLERLELSLAGAVLSHATVPMFENLISLKIKGDPDLCYEQLEMILNKCPRLENLEFPMGVARMYNFDCLLSSEFMGLSANLKNITIGYFKGEIKELVAVNAFLAKSTTLETMEICFARCITNRNEIETFLSAIPMASRSCKLDFKCTKVTYMPVWD